MDAKEYYKKVFSRLENCFEYNDFAIAVEDELIKEGCDPSFPALCLPIDSLSYLSEQRGLQVHLPIVGTKSQSVLMPMDFEIFLSKDNYKLYTDKESQRDYFKQTVPVLDFIKKIFTDRGMPFLLDYTPSGGHILFQNLLSDRSTLEIQKIGYLEEDLIRSCKNVNPSDLRRRHGISLEAASVFSGLGRIAEYVAFLTMTEFKNEEAEGRLPVTISDALDKCINLDNSWAEGSPHMRSIRSPFSMHKKNHEKYKQYNVPPLVDVIGGSYDGKKYHGHIDVDNVIECMWDLEKAAEHSQQFSGIIPTSNDSMIDFIAEYKKSDLYKFHQEFDAEPDLPHGQALAKAKKENNVPDWTKNIVFNPNPLAVRPINIIGFVYDFVIRAKWHPKHVANILRDIYLDPANKWTQDFIDAYPAEEKANFWTRTYAGIAYWNEGTMKF